MAALGANMKNHLACDLPFETLKVPFPAVTCSVQASFRTAAYPAHHGMVANGLYLRDFAKPLFWEQSAGLVGGKRIWTHFRENGGRVGLTFWQQSLGEEVDLLLSPKPIHKHHGGMIQSCYSTPASLEKELTKSVGRSFNLMHYWGPMTSIKGSEWIIASTEAILARKDAPELLITYLPHLDYDLQRHGPDHARSRRAGHETGRFLQRLKQAAEDAGYDYLFYGDYAIERVSGGPVYPNRELREAGLFDVYRVRDAAYPDFYASRAFCLVDHQVAHVYVGDNADIATTAELFEQVEGVDSVLASEQQEEAGIRHVRSGELVLVASPGYWFAYPWWRERKEAPDYADHVDIHNKPGFDPAELFFGWPPPHTSVNADRIGGTHGRTCEAAWSTSLTFASNPEDIFQLAGAVRQWLDEEA